MDRGGFELRDPISVDHVSAVAAAIGSEKSRKHVGQARIETVDHGNKCRNPAVGQDLNRVTARTLFDETFGRSLAPSSQARQEAGKDEESHHDRCPTPATKPEDRGSDDNRCQRSTG